MRPPALTPLVARSIPRLAISAIHLPAVNLDKAELDVLATLHRQHADLGELVTVSRSSREVQVGLWELPTERQNELRAALGDQPGVQVELTAPPPGAKKDVIARACVPVHRHRCLVLPCLSWSIPAPMISAC